VIFIIDFFYSTYLTNLKTVNEIGVAFSKECDCYLGEIILEEKDRQFGEWKKVYNQYFNLKICDNEIAVCSKRITLR